MNHAGDAVQDVGEVAEGVANALGVDLQTVLHSGLRSLIILVGAWVVYRLFKLVTRRLQQHFDRQIQDERGRRAETIVQLLNSVVGVVIGVAAILTVLNYFIAIGPLLAGVGVAGLAISFGAQSLVKDVISGFFIIVENQFTVDDIVEINGKAGVVEGMTLRVVMLRDVEGVLHVIPNGSINMVSNRTRDWSRAIVDIGVAYKESVDDVIRVMREVGHEIWEDPDWRPKLVEEPAVWGVEALAESSVNIRIVAGTEPGRQWEVRRELRRRLKNRFDAEGIEIPLPQRTLHVADRASIRESLSNRVRETAP
jgi:small conductance mechanosensitive channel